jgi:hypothetical protein
VGGYGIAGPIYDDGPRLQRSLLRSSNGVFTSIGFPGAARLETVEDCLRGNRANVNGG